MKNPGATDFVVIDDEPMSNRICEIVITRIFPESDLQTFTDPEKAFNHLASHYAKAQANNVIVFLDLKMPVMDGWVVLQKIDELLDEVKQRMNIYILSSSTDRSDVKRANENPLVKKFIRKPLLINTLRKQIANADFL
jgi:response regulator RpfG family c-di-GMP phosphodiesterase